jgi:hypothetical protein
MCNSLGIIGYKVHRDAMVLSSPPAEQGTSARNEPFHLFSLQLDVDMILKDKEDCVGSPANQERKTAHNGGNTPLDVSYVQQEEVKRKVATVDAQPLEALYLKDQNRTGAEEEGLEDKERDGIGAASEKEAHGALIPDNIEIQGD